MIFRTLLVLFLAAVMLQSCYNDKRDQLYPNPIAGGCDTTNVTYSGFVSQVLAAKCAVAGCHNAATSSAGITLDNYNGVKNATSNGRLVGAISHATGFTPMPNPPGSPKLHDCTIAKISAWVAKGAPNN